MKKKGLLCVALAFFCQVASRAQSAPPLAAQAAQMPSVATGEMSAAAALAERATPVHIKRFAKPPVIDGKLDDEVWQTAAAFKGFFQTQPGDNIAPSYPTELKIGYDDKFLYLAFHAYDDPGKVRATVAKRDDVLDDDNVSVYLDTLNDKRKAYVLIFNPLGVQQDGVISEGGSEDYSVDIVMESKGLVTQDGYTVEVAVPFKSLRYVAGKDKLWGIHAFRHIKHVNNEQDSWMPILRDKSGFLSQEGYITGIEGVSTERTIELIPSLTVSESGKRVRASPVPPAPDAGRFLNKPLGFDPGLTAKLGITPTVTLALAVNPDFAQVEADQTVVTANQRFPIFFQEKRPFFLEGKEIFETLLNPVHTRTIVDPDYAVKLTGKQGRNTFGLMFASDNAPGNYSDEERSDPTLRPKIEKFLDKNSYVGVLRLKRDIGKENSLGFIATSYNFIEKHNDVAGFDGRFRLNPQTTFTFQVLGTTSRRFFYDPSQDKNIYRTGNGFGYGFRLEDTGRHFSYSFVGSGRTRDYRADVGFTRRTDTNDEELMVRYTSDQKPKAKLVSWSTFNLTQVNYDWLGRSQFLNNNSQVSFNFQRQTYLGLGLQKGYERLFEEEFGPKRGPGRAGAFIGDDPERSAYRKMFYVYGGTTPSKKYSLASELDYTWGAFDYDGGAGPRFPRVSPAALINPDAPLDPGPGSELTFTASAIYQPSSALRLSLDYTKDKLTRYDTGRVAFDDNIYALRATYQFTRFAFARARVDYDTLASNVRSQFLFGWTPNPGTAFYVGYNNDLNYNGFSPFTGLLEPGFQRNGQTFFIKLSYLLRKGSK